MKAEPQGIIISGIVSYRDKQPYVQMVVDGHLVQLTMRQARNVARDIENQCSRAEADAMIHKFFSASQYPEGANNAIMVAFRDFRAQLDQEEIDTFMVDPDDETGERPQ
jgi:hypothetical protein